MKTLFLIALTINVILLAPLFEQIAHAQDATKPSLSDIHARFTKALDLLDELEDLGLKADPKEYRKAVRTLRTELMMGLAEAKLFEKREPKQKQRTNAAKSEMIIKAPKTVTESRCKIETTITPSQLKGNKQCWVAVIPVLAPDKAWVQGSRLTGTSSTRVVYLGLENVKTDEEFQVVILSCPRNAIKRDGPIPVSDFDKLGIEQHASTIVHRRK